ncbi:MAG: recombination mediator RecR [bacterium]|nr:recombination mediator RecR [bacterium]
MKLYSDSFEKLINELSRLPGIGPKTAQRLAFFILKMQKEEAESLAFAIQEVKNKIHYCKVCNNLTESDICNICSDQNRNKEIICVVEEPNDLIAIEKTRGFRGVYHILLGRISPMDGLGPEDIKIDSLVGKVKKGGIREVILAINPNVEGEATALYIAKQLKPFSVKITRLAHGLPMGADLEYADEVTLTRAMEGRSEMFST